ncbi:MAG: hypothetical protein ACLR56_13670 [Oscillospiraceae bacterium]
MLKTQMGINGETVGKCGNGLMVLFGAETNDTGGRGAARKNSSLANIL